MSNSVSLNELYTLQEVYNIEFGVRGYWKCMFDNAPNPYRKKAMLAKSCNESDFDVTFDGTVVGLINIYTPGVQKMPTLNITFYDDNDNVITNWLRDWKKQMKQGNSTLSYIEDYADFVYCYQYSPQHKLLESRKYLVAPAGKIQIQNGDEVGQALVQMEFQVFSFDYS